MGTGAPAGGAGSGPVTHGGAAPAARATIVGAVGGRRAVAVTVRCAAPKGCRVALRLTARTGRARVTVGSATATVTGRQTLTIRLNAAGRRLLRGHRRLAVRLVATQDGAALGLARTVSVRAR